jgi:predicted unusual protein kinase regulating ubiquinone biosynthesis (AarF/ABC1/UbiB family)
VIERDLAALANLAELAERRTPLGRSVRSGEILGQFARSLRAELDYLGEPVDLVLQDPHHPAYA